MIEELRGILRDLEATYPVPVTVTDIAPDRMVRVEVEGDAGAIEVRVVRAAPALQRAEEASDAVHDWVVEALPGLGYPAVWPACRRHPGAHPLEIATAGERLVWRCPQSGTAQATVGDLIT